MRIQDLAGLGEGKFPDVIKSKSSFLHGVRDCHSLEVSAQMYGLCFCLDKRVVTAFVSLL